MCGGAPSAPKAPPRLPEAPVPPPMIRTTGVSDSGPAGGRRRRNGAFGEGRRTLLTGGGTEDAAPAAPTLQKTLLGE